MKKILTIMLTAIAILVIMLSFTVSASQQVQVTTASFPVVINGNIVNNRMREYPFILYKDITYFPMTYEDCAFLGVENNWTAQSGNILTKATPSGVYCDYISTQLSLVKHGKVATIVSTPITVLGETIDNNAQEFPILNYNNVLYFPLTWDWSQKFGWSTIFHTNRTLEVTTEGFDNAGYCFLYSIDKSKEPKKLDIQNTDLRYMMDTYIEEYSYSPNYSGNPSATADGYKFLYKLVMADGTTTNHITVNDKLYQKFKQDGWFEIGEEEQAVAEFAKTHSMRDTARAITPLPYIKIADSDLESILYNIATKYTTLISADHRICAVKESDAQAYKSVGWMGEEEYLDYYVNLCLASGDTGSAMTFLEKTLGEEIAENFEISAKIPWDYDYSRVEQKYYDITKSVLNKMSKAVQVRDVYDSARVERGKFIVLNCAVPARKTVKSVEVSFDVVDAGGKVIASRTVTENIYAQNYTDGKLFVAEGICYAFQSPAENGIKNVKVKKINIVDTDFRPGGQG